MPTPPSDIPPICVAPAGRRYGFRRLDDLRADLDAASRSTVVEELADPSQVRLRPDGTTADGRRLTQTGLRHVCNALAPGLNALATDLAGCHRGPDDPPEAYSCREAIAAYNAVLARRFPPRMAGRYSMVVDAAAGTIDGLIGPGYRFLDHARFLEVALAAARDAGRDLEFLEAALGDRRLAVRLVERRRLAADPDGASWFAGLHFANSELGGEQAACGSLLLVQPRARLHALGPARTSRAAHAGRGFEEKLLQALLTVAASPADPGGIAAAFAGLAARPLPLPAGREGGWEAVEELAARLARQGLPRGLAARAAAMAAGRIADDSSPGTDAPAPGGPATEWDIYKSIAAVAQCQGQPLRERVERIAFGCLREQPS